MIDILKIARYGKLKTHIMQEASLSFKQLEYYLKHLISKNFVKKEGRIYRTTDKGLSVIEACQICLRLTE